MDGDAGEEDDGEEDEQDEDELEDEVALSPADTDAEDPDHELEGEYDEDMAEEDEEDEEEWRENRIIGVQWRDGVNGFNHIEVLGHTDAGNQDSTIDPLQAMNFEQLFGAFRPRGGSGRRGSAAYMVFERAGTETTRNTRHPLLNRTNLPGSGGLSISSSWVSTGGNVFRAPNSVLSGSLDSSRLYTWYDSTTNDNGGDDIFRDRVVGQDSVFLDIPMLPRVGRRNSRGDGQLSSWTDDGEFQGGAANAALAQAFEEHFVSRFSSSNSGDQSSNRPGDSLEMTVGTVELSTGGGANAEHNNELPQENTLLNEPLQVLENEGSSLNALNSGEGRRDDQNSNNAGLDVQMQDETTGSSVKDIEAASQDSSGSGATVGESLRSLEVEIGSADGHDESDRSAADRVGIIHPANEATNMAVGTRERLPQVDVQSRDSEAMDVRSSLGISEPTDTESGPSGRVEETGGREDLLHDEQAINASLNSIDPTFLEALPQDLRAEVLGSQQTGTRTEDHQPPSTVEDIDPEFLAALPPEIQAEVLAQQRAQQLLQSQFLEGHPVDMDSASIIATFPAELREEVSNVLLLICSICSVCSFFVYKFFYLDCRYF
jgi:E3 ubiquitin-protein ligase HUWE1